VEGTGVRRRSSLLVSNGAASLHQLIGVARSGRKREENAMAVKIIRATLFGRVRHERGVP
jgi:hypothetical protein